MAALSYWVFQRYSVWSRQKQDANVPVSKVQRSDISFTITAKGELRGSNPETLMAPPAGGDELHITYMRKNGEQIKPGDVIVRFDTGEQEYKLKEAQADQAEAEQKIIQAKGQRDAQKEEDQYALIKANTDVKVAEFDVRKNPLLPAITAKQNLLALDSAKEHLRQVQQNLANRATTGDAGITKEEAGKIKAESQVKTAQENIQAMTLRAKHAGYVSIKQNTNTNFGYDGMILPELQVGDSVRSGMPIAEIPDLNNWEIAASVGEADRGHVTIGDLVRVRLVALPGQIFRGHVQDLGGTVGNFWERHFECKVALDEKSDAMRPGMSTELVIATETMHSVLSVPTQALFDADGATYVYVRDGKTFVRKDVKLVRKNETRAVVSGLGEGQLVALANPLERPKAKQNSSALTAAPK
jgi:HlyD family secretion protein